MRTILLGDIGNRLDIEDTEREIASLQAQQNSSARALRDRDDEIGRLKREVGQQKLAIEALTRFLVLKGTIDQKQLDEFIKEVDAEDGVIDGMMALDPVAHRLCFPKKRIEEGTFRKTTDV
ncbi:MAG: hypothetical protein ACPG4K_08180 [Haloferula sp.]